MKPIEEFLKDGEYLGDLKDFHDCKDVFKLMHHVYNPKGSVNPPHEMPGWADGQIYVVDFFLHFMARHGYTLQRSRKNVEFRDLWKRVSEFKEQQAAAFFGMLQKNRQQQSKEDSTQ